MRDIPALAALLPTLPLQPFQGVLYRAVTLEALYGFHRNPPYPQVRPLYNLGAPAAGARYTPLGGPPSLYLAVDADTAIAEVNQVYARLIQSYSACVRSHSALRPFQRSRHARRRTRS